MQTRPIRAVVRRSLATAAVTALAASTLVGLAASADADGASIFVNPGGVDSPGCGSVAQQCLTIQTGIDQAETGDTVVVAPGTYNEVIHVDKGVRVQGEQGATIDGTARTQSSASAYGVVHVGGSGPLGDVAVTGFTIRNAEGMPGNGALGADGPPVLVALVDGYAADTVTVSDNTLVGSDDDAIGFSGTDNAATTAITGNSVSRVHQGVALRDNGPVRVDSNVFDHLSTRDEGSGVTAGGRGVVLSAANGGARTGQVVFGNTFRDYAGDGVVLSAADDGTCAADPEVDCEGGLIGEAVANTFDLRPTADGVRTAAAIRLAATDGFSLTATTGGNTGVVGAPTRPVVETTARGGTLAVARTGGANTISPDPAPLVSVSAPSTVSNGAAPVDLSVSSTVPTAGVPLSNARLDLVLSAAGLTADDLVLQQRVGDSWVPVALSDGADGTVTGRLGPAAGLARPADGKPVVTPLRLQVAPDAPVGGLSLRTALVEVSSGTDPVAIDEEAFDTARTSIAPAATTVIGTPTYDPAQPSTGSVPTMNVPVSSAGEVDGGTVTVVAGTLTSTGIVTDGVAAVPLKKFSGGPHTVTVSYGGSAHAPAAGPVDVTVDVAKVTPALTTKLSPTPLRATTTNGRLVVVVDAPGTSAAGGTVRVYTKASPNIARGTVDSTGKVRLVLPRLKAGPRTWTVTYAGNRFVEARTTTVSFTVAR